MKTVQIGNVVIGAGRPKICVPVLGKSLEEVKDSAARCREALPDVAEWRADWFEHVHDHNAVRATLGEIKATLGGIPLLFTFRSAREGGEREIDPNSYAGLNKFAIQSGLIDLIDVELFTGDIIVWDLIHEAHEHGVSVLTSNHDFNKTPEHGEIISRLLKMQQLGADILKIAVMPQSRQDVLTLLSATADMYENYAERPLVTMSMGPLGLLSRLGGESFGSAMSFGSAGRASAPGQIDAESLRKVLDIIHAAN